MKQNIIRELTKVTNDDMKDGALVKKKRTEKKTAKITQNWLNWKITQQKFSKNSQKNFKRNNICDSHSNHNK